MNSFARPPHFTRGLTLVEIIVAIGVFSIIMLALSGTIVQGLQIRRNNSVDSQANAYAASILELYKNFYSDSTNFNDRRSPTIPSAPAGLSPVVGGIDTTVTCINSGGLVVSTNCDLLRVTVTVLDLSNPPKVRTSLVTEIGKPLQ